ncbi:hypothetical protein BO94DRAFT_548130 [Aspergillus sclerotioniger CBS 115572]|uniref:Fungal-type protein kinase domain-containing protein n=1 Tax=Aspergillus sclerotioniger CBS 115572 TaxID=1450535 RepID=A0A317W2V9_9EURO|nr:hypothetical protein BO94DRAFT_548130 [Aspergillus sclerotioniger CBS 115572]PWY80833.1 hypothetical protein BO94DRAFT_548130 [Aspergillus sclerotioniger CBS 115572]
MADLNPQGWAESLLHYLQHHPPQVPIIPNPPQITTSTRNRQYSAFDITHLGHSVQFNLNTILEQYNVLLRTTPINNNPMPLSSPRPNNSGMGLRRRIIIYLERLVQCSLQSIFNQPRKSDRLEGYTILDFEEGELAQVIEDYKPDTSFYDTVANLLNRPNRLPGEIKPSYTWSTALNILGPGRKFEFKQVLSQLNWYMKQHQAKYGFLLTDRELVAVKRLDGQGKLELSGSIPWDIHGSEDQPRLTVLLALWYLGMLAANDQDW